MKKISILLIMIMAGFAANAQVAINKDGSAPDSSTILHVKGGGDHFFKIDNASGTITMDEGEINRNAQGTADLLPVSYGMVDRDGDPMEDGTFNWTSTRVGNGKYEISGAGSFSFDSGDIVVLTARTYNSRMISYKVSSGKIKVRIYEIGAGGVPSLVDTDFNFVVYRR